MPYGRSGYAPYLAMRDLGNTLYSGLSGIGQQKIQSEDRSFNRMLQENQLGRQTEADARAREMYAAQKPGMEMKAMEDRAKLERLESPVTLGELAVDQYGLDLWTNVPKGDSKSLTEKFGEMFGAKYDTDPKSPNRGKFVKADGTPLKRKDLEPKWQEFNQLVTSHIDPETALEDQVSRYQDKINWLKSKGAKDNDPQMVQAMRNLQAGTSILQDPAKRLKILERQRDTLSKFSNADAKRQAERLDAKIDKIHEQAIKEREKRETREFEVKKIEFQEGKKDARAKLSADTRLKAADKVAGTKEKKLTPQEAAEVKTLQSEYNSNLNVIEEYRKGNQLVTPEKAAAARRNNVDIVKKLKKIGVSEKSDKNLDPLGLFDDEEEEE